MNETTPTTPAIADEATDDSLETSAPEPAKFAFECPPLALLAVLVLIIGFIGYLTHRDRAQVDEIKAKVSELQIQIIGLTENRNGWSNAAVSQAQMLMNEVGKAKERELQIQAMIAQAARANPAPAPPILTPIGSGSNNAPAKIENPVKK